MGVSWTQSELGWVVGHTSQEVGGPNGRTRPPAVRRRAKEHQGVGWGNSHPTNQSTPAADRRAFWRVENKDCGGQDSKNGRKLALGFTEPITVRYEQRAGRQPF